MGLHAWPWPSQDPILGSIHERRPELYAMFQWPDSTVWFTTPFIAINVLLSLGDIFAARWDRVVVALTAPTVRAIRSPRGSGRRAGPAARSDGAEACAGTSLVRHPGTWLVPQPSQRTRVRRVTRKVFSKTRV